MAPNAASASAMAKPSPREAPVTSATRPSSRNMSFISASPVLVASVSLYRGQDGEARGGWSWFHGPNLSPSSNNVLRRQSACMQRN